MGMEKNDADDMKLLWLNRVAYEYYNQNEMIQRTNQIFNKAKKQYRRSFYTKVFLPMAASILICILMLHGFSSQKKNIKQEENNVNSCHVISIEEEMTLSSTDDSIVIFTKNYEGNE